MPDPKAVPDDDDVRTMAAEDARAVAEQLRDSERPDLPLSGDYPKTALHLRHRSMADWPDDLRTIYLDALRDRLADEDIGIGRDSILREYAVEMDREQWNYSPDTGWTQHSD